MSQSLSLMSQSLSLMSQSLSLMSQSLYLMSQSLSLMSQSLSLMSQSLSLMSQSLSPMSPVSVSHDTSLSALTFLLGPVSVFSRVAPILRWFNGKCHVDILVPAIFLPRLASLL